MFIIRINEDVIFMICIITYYIFNALNLFLKLVVEEFEIWTILLRIALAFMIMTAMIVAFQKRTKVICLVEWSMAFLFVMTSLRGMYGSDYSFLVLRSLCVFIPLGICIYCIKDIGHLIGLLHNSSWIIHFVLITEIFLFKDENGNTYSISLGYALLTQALIMFDHVINANCNLLRKILEISLIIADCMLILWRGSRGPFVCLAIFVALYLLSSQIKKKGIMIAVVITAIGGYLNKKWIMQGLESFWRGVDLQSRTIDLFFMTSVSDVARLELFGLYSQSSGNGTIELVMQNDEWI